MSRRIAVCFLTLSAKRDARKVATILQREWPDDEVVLFDRVHPSPFPPPKALKACDMRVYVDTEKRKVGGEDKWY